MQDEKRERGTPVECKTNQHPTAGGSSTSKENWEEEEGTHQEQIKEATPQVPSQAQITRQAQALPQETKVSKAKKRRCRLALTQYCSRQIVWK